MGHRHRDIYIISSQLLGTSHPAPPYSKGAGRYFCVSRKGGEPDSTSTVSHFCNLSLCYLRTEEEMGKVSGSKRRFGTLKTWQPWKAPGIGPSWRLTRAAARTSE